MKCDFTFRHYLEILEKFKKLDYQFGLFNNQTGGKVVYLRHDLDHSIIKALPLADLERSVGAKATYCIRLSSPFDNTFSRENREALKKIYDRGHDLALHYERESWSGEMIDEIDKQFEVLSKYFPIKKIVSFHRPQQDILNKHFDNYVNTYDQPYFGDLKYLSDSTGNWREGCICQWLEKNKDKNINYQMLTHPIWWGREEGDRFEHLHNWMREKMYDWDKEMYEDNPYYTERLK